MWDGVDGGGDPGAVSAGEDGRSDIEVPDGWSEDGHLKSRGGKKHRKSKDTASMQSEEVGGKHSRTTPPTDPTPPPSTPATTGRGRGRPPGSKNKSFTKERSSTRISPRNKEQPSPSQARTSPPTIALDSDVEDISDTHAPEDATGDCLLYTSPSPRDRQKSRMPSSA